MAAHEVQFPLDASAYEILAEIGSGVSAVVYKALCPSANSAVVAIKSIDLDRSSGVRFGGETFIPSSSESHESCVSSVERGDESGESMDSNRSSVVGVERNVGLGGVDKEVMVGGLTAFMRSLEEQKSNVVTLMGLLRGEEVSGEVVMSREEQMGQVIERMRVELENERERNFQLEMELEFLRIQISGAYTPTNGSGNID
ncbi:hypothetical protein ACLB2K_038493 [Fragaria x ananassa]